MSGRGHEESQDSATEDNDVSEKIEDMDVDESSDQGESVDVQPMEVDDDENAPSEIRVLKGRNEEILVLDRDGRQIQDQVLAPEL